MKKILRLGESAKGGRAREDVLDILGLRIIVDMETSHPSSHTLHDAAEVQSSLLPAYRAAACHQLWHIA